VAVQFYWSRLPSLPFAKPDGPSMTRASSRDS
jgi:hypothetical protein